MNNKIIVLKFDQHHTITIHGFSKGPIWLTSFFLLMDMYILITSQSSNDMCSSNL